MSGEKGIGATDKIGALLAAAGAAMVVGFFLAWVDLGDFGSTSGFDLARDGGWTNHALALAPLAGVVVLGWTAYQAGHDVVRWLQWGGWLAIAGAAALIGSGAAKQRGLALVAGAVAGIAFFLPWYGGASGFEIARGAGIDEFY